MNFKFKTIVLGMIIISCTVLLTFKNQIFNLYMSQLNFFNTEKRNITDNNSIYASASSTNHNPLTLNSRSIDKSRYITSPPESSQSYNKAILSAKTIKERQLESYINASSKNQKNEVLNQSKSIFTNTVSSLVPYWYGTPWDYNGTTEIPQQGNIACGYFVTTILEDAGLHIERSILAQQASENIIKSLTTEDHIKRYSNISFEEFIHSINNWGEGLYIVGLDFHVGFIWHDGNNINFIHSTILAPKGVLSEPAESSKILENSKYRVLGKISEDKALLAKWLNSTKIKTKT